MATKSVGLTARDFSTMAAYASYVNALTFSAPEILEVYNDGGAVTDTTTVTLNGWTGGSTINTLTIRAAAGHSFRDNVSVQTNALRHNASNGAALTNSITGNTAYVIGGNVIIDGLMIENTHINASSLLVVGVNFKVKNCILRSNAAGGGLCTIVTGQNGLIVENSVIHVTNGGDGIRCTSNNDGHAFTGVLFIATGSTGNKGYREDYAQATKAIAKNCAFYGFTTDIQVQGTGSTSCTNNATDKSTFGSANWGTSGQVSITSTEWVSVTSGSEDFRRASGSTKLKDNGVVAGRTTDIVGTSLPQGPACDIGPWEVPVTSATINLTTSACTGGAVSGTSAITITPTTPGVVNLAVSSCTGGAVSGTSTITITSAMGTITTDEFTYYGSQTPIVGLTLAHSTFQRVSDGVQVLNLAGLVTNGSGKIVTASTSLVSGVAYLQTDWNTDGTLRACEKYTAS